MANSFVTNLYPKPTGGTSLRKMIVDSTSAAHTILGDSTVNDGSDTAGSTSFNSLTKYIVLDVQDADVFVTYDGTTPNANYGHRLYAGRSYTWSKIAATEAKFVAVGSNAVIQSSEYTD
jgi:hypothetical protein|tara:strand:- start:147 stop:503 length:357 start_codon:yes stop_codon:yes gene_type:complete